MWEAVPSGDLFANAVAGGSQ